MSFSAFVLFYAIILWLIFGQKWLVSKVDAKKDTNPFYRTVHKFGYLAGTGIAISVIIELVVLACERF